METTEKLAALRSLMEEAHMDAYIIPTDDFHCSEYVGEYFKAREYMSGFTGSAGTLVVLREQAVLWTDGRYFIQAAAQLQNTPIALMRAGQPGVPKIPAFLAEKLPENSVIGFDGRTVTKHFVDTLTRQTTAKNMTFAGGRDLVDCVWQDRPPISTEPVWEVDAAAVGLGREEKLERVRARMREEKADVLLLTALDEIAWLTNLRGGDVSYTPVFLAYMLIEAHRARLFVHERILSGEIRRKLEQAGIETAAYDGIEQALRELPEQSRVWADSAGVSYSLWNSMPNRVEIIDRASPAVLLKAVKTPQEMAHIRAAHHKDGLAVTRFIRWLKESVGRGEPVTELSAARRLEMFRGQAEGYLGPSFAPIIAYGAHGAIVHYEPTEETDVKMENRGFCLADTGGHYTDGTTDVTRTIALGELTDEEKRYYTLVLRGHLALGAARFTEGVCGQNLDILARTPLWENGLDYNHGTGHGVGFLLNVHEGPQRIHWRISEDTPGVALQEGMVISNEPGIYLEGKFGVRHENLVLCRLAEKNAYGQFLYLEPLTMVPFDREAILPELMTDREIAWLNDYHQKVYRALSPGMDGEELAWLEKATAPL